MTIQKAVLKEKSFRDCTLAYLDDTFNLEQVKTLITDEIFDICRILKALKVIVIELTA